LDPDPLVRGTDPGILIRTKMSRIPNTDLKHNHNGIDIARKMHVSREEFLKGVRGSTPSLKLYIYIGESFTCTTTILFLTNETSVNTHLCHPKDRKDRLAQHSPIGGSSPRCNFCAMISLYLSIIVVVRGGYLLPTSTWRLLSALAAVVLGT
jgi:hypothetical protein